MTTRKVGPFTREELMQLWRSAVDEEFARPLLEDPESGIEAIEQAAEQWAAVSVDIDRTKESFFLRHWSGETAPPASGPSFASVMLELSRAVPAGTTIVLDTNRVLFEEEVPDYGPTGAIPTRTGRRYLLAERFVLLPGMVGPIPVPAIAEQQGSSYNFPLPGSIVAIVDAGTASGTGAMVVPGVTNHALVLGLDDDVPPPTAAGQYARIVSGANAGQLRRVLSVDPPLPSSLDNGTVTLSAEGTFTLTSLTGSFLLGEEVTGGTSGAVATVLGADGSYLAYDSANATVEFSAGETVTGTTSGATATVGIVEQPAGMAAGPAGWEILSWKSGLGLSVTNPESPDGGGPGELDFIGSEKGMGRASGEPDEPYRERLEELPDVVSPNALLRAANRILAPYGVRACLREVGELDKFPGFFYDVPPMVAVYCYDDQRPEDAFKLVMSLFESRAFFMIGVPRLNLGEFGFCFDQGFDCFFDTPSPLFDFWDGFPLVARQIYRRIWQALDFARAAGVGFDIYFETLGCA